MALRGVPVAGQDEPLGVQLPLEHVAHRVERRRMAARDDEFRERRPGERGKRDLGLPLEALADEGASTLLERRRQRRGRVVVRPDEAKEPAKECLGSSRGP